MKLTKHSQRLAMALVLTVLPTASPAADSLVLWYQQPARNWNEALPVGNGRLGAMVFGGVELERLQLNEDSVWSGAPQDADNPKALEALPEIRRLLFAGNYVAAQKLANRTLICQGPGSNHGRGAKVAYGSYETLGDLKLAFPTSTNSPVTHYRRELDLATATVRISYEQGGVKFQREVFASFPDQVLVVRLTASRRGALSFLAGLERPEAAQVRADGPAGLLMQGQLWNGVTNAGMQFAARLRAVVSGGRVSSDGDVLNVTGADAVTLLLTAATDYSMQLPDWRQGDPAAKTQAQLTAALRKSHRRLRAAHVADYEKMFERVEFELAGDAPAHPARGPALAQIPTDQRLKAVGEGAFDPDLVALYFQFGRYLMIASSRPGDLPANLQGLWAGGIQNPWSSDYHANINLQMIYWPAPLANLFECFEPLERYVQFLTEPGARTARVHYNARGWTVHTLANAWGFTAPGESPSWGLSPSAGAWLAQHLWEQFQFTQDTNLLRRVLPVLRGSAAFSLDWLVEHPQTGKLVAGPATSPENTFITADGQKAALCMGPMMEQQIIWDCFRNYLAAVRVLGTHEPLVPEVEAALGRLQLPQIGRDGRLMEWSEEFKEAEPGHRHMSHLFALHPGNQITRRGTPELAVAARKSLEYRVAHGGGHTGWSRAWMINFWARLGDGVKAGENLQALLAKSTLPNLFDTHPPFQIDGNFGGLSGICEMLVQSHAGEIELLPALPPAWMAGEVEGLRARGGCTVDLEWQHGKLLRARIKSAPGGVVRLRYGEEVREVKLRRGGTYTWRAK
jgi:alpha-L-fucosidase 2